MTLTKRGATGLDRTQSLLNRLIEFAATLPERMRIRGSQGKWLMKQAMRRHLPDQVLFRPKMGFVTPIAASNPSAWMAIWTTSSDVASAGNGKVASTASNARTRSDSLCSAGDRVIRAAASDGLGRSS